MARGDPFRELLLQVHVHVHVHDVKSCILIESMSSFNSLMLSSFFRDAKEKLGKDLTIQIYRYKQPSFYLQAATQGELKVPHRFEPDPILTTV